MGVGFLWQIFLVSAYSQRVQIPNNWVLEFWVIVLLGTWTLEDWVSYLGDLRDHNIKTMGHVLLQQYLVVGHV